MSMFSKLTDGSGFLSLLLIPAVCLPGSAAEFVKVADFPDYGTWGATDWNGRIYVGFYTHQHGRDLPIYRSGVNDEKFEFVRMLGSGESLPELFVSPDGKTLHATTEGHSGPSQSPGMHWWTTDQENAMEWQSQSFSERTEYRWGIASLVHGNDMYMAFSGARVGAKILKYEQGEFKQFGPVVTPDEHSIVLEMQVFHDTPYAAGGLSTRWDKPDCGRVYRLNTSENKWESVFSHEDGLIGCSAIFDGKLWVGTVFGTKVYSTKSGTDWKVAYDFNMKGSWPGPDAMTVHKNTLYVSCGNRDDIVKIIARPLGGEFKEVYSSNDYVNISAFVTRGEDLYAFGEKKEGGGMALKLLEKK